MMRKILVVEDEPSIADNITYALSTEGFSSEWRTTGSEALELLAHENFDLLILDIGLPDINGFELAKSVFKRYTLPIIFVTARNSEIDKVVGLEIGADDYVVKPFSPRELTARVKAVLRRVGQNSAPIASSLQTSLFVVDDQRHQIFYQGTPLDLSRYEFGLLRLFIQNPGRVYTREQLMNHVWQEPDMSLERTVDTHIKTIRQKLRSLGADDGLIITHRGIGYSIKENI